MFRRRRPVKRFVPRLEKLEQRSLLSASGLAAASQNAAAAALSQAGHPGAEIAAGNVNGQLAVVGATESHFVVTGKRQYKPFAVDIENYNPPNPATGASVGSFTAGTPVNTDLPAGPGVKIAFGDVNKDGVDDLYMAVAAPDGKGAIAVELFQGSFNSSSGWQFALETKGTCYGMTAAGGNKGYGVMVGDINGDGKADVVLTSDTKVGFVLSNGSSYQTPVVRNPFVSIEDHKNISDGAAKGQAVDAIIQNGQGGDDLVTEANDEFLFTPIVVNSVTPGSTGQGTQTVGFDEPIESIAIKKPGIPSTVEQAVPLQGPITVADEIFVAGTLDIVDPCPPHVICVGLVAVVGDKVYVGAGSTPYTQGSTGTLTPGPLTFTWSADTLGPQSIGRPLFLTDVNNDNQLDLVSLQINKTRDEATPQLTVVEENVFGGPLD